MTAKAKYRLNALIEVGVAARSRADASAGSADMGDELPGVDNAEDHVDAVRGNQACTHREACMGMNVITSGITHGYTPLTYRRRLRNGRVPG